MEISDVEQLKMFERMVARDVNRLYMDVNLSIRMAQNHLSRIQHLSLLSTNILKADEFLGCFTGLKELILKKCRLWSSDTLYNLTLTAETMRSLIRFEI